MAIQKVNLQEIRIAEGHFIVPCVLELANGNVVTCAVRMKISSDPELIAMAKDVGDLLMTKIKEQFNSGIVTIARS